MSAWKEDWNPAEAKNKNKTNKRRKKQFATSLHCLYMVRRRWELDLWICFYFGCCRVLMCVYYWAYIVYRMKFHAIKPTTSNTTSSIILWPEQQALHITTTNHKHWHTRTRSRIQNDRNRQCSKINVNKSVAVGCQWQRTSGVFLY